MSENLRSSANVELYGYKSRKYWSIKQCTTTVLVRSILVMPKKNKKSFKNEFRYFLYGNQLKFDDYLQIIKDEDSSILIYKGISKDMRLNTKALLKELDLTKSISIKIREYEKEYFYLKCLYLGIKPQYVLRTLYRIAVICKPKEKVFTAPETIFQGIRLVERDPIYEKDISFRS